MKNILFVCTDNIGRSVIAEYSLKDLLNRNKIDDVFVSSAGTNADSDISGFSMAHFPEMKKVKFTKDLLVDTPSIMANPWLKEHAPPQTEQAMPFCTHFTNNALNTMLNFL